MVTVVRNYAINTFEAEDRVTVRETANYDQFVYDARNRPIDWDHVQELFDSITENNLLDNFPIVVEERNGRLVVLDGQHRLEVARIMECPIYYIVTRKMTFADVHRINGSTQGWNSENFLNRWIREDRLEYMRLASFLERFPHIGLSFAITICMCGSSKTIRAAYRNGSYVCDNMTVANRLGEASKSMEKYAPEFIGRTHFLVALKSLLANPNYDHDTMLRKLDFQSSRIVKCPDSMGYLRMLIDIYNYKSRGPLLSADGISLKSRPRVAE